MLWRYTLSWLSLWSWVLGICLLLGWSWHYQRDYQVGEVLPWTRHILRPAARGVVEGDAHSRLWHKEVFGFVDFRSSQREGYLFGVLSARHDGEGACTPVVSRAARPRLFGEYLGDCSVDGKCHICTSLLFDLFRGSWYSCCDMVQS